MSPAVLGVCSMPTIPVPSGATNDGAWQFGLVVSRSTMPVPSAACVNRF